MLAAIRYPCALVSMASRVVWPVICAHCARAPPPTSAYYCSTFPSTPRTRQASRYHSFIPSFDSFMNQQRILNACAHARVCVTNQIITAGQFAGCPLISLKRRVAKARRRHRYEGVFYRHDCRFPEERSWIDTITRFPPSPMKDERGFPILPPIEYLPMSDRFFHPGTGMPMQPNEFTIHDLPIQFVWEFYPRVAVRTRLHRRSLDANATNTSSLSSSTYTKSST